MAKSYGYMHFHPHGNFRIIGYELADKDSFVNSDLQNFLVHLSTYNYPCIDDKVFIPIFRCLNDRDELSFIPAELLFFEKTLPCYCFMKPNAPKYEDGIVESAATYKFDNVTKTFLEINKEWPYFDRIVEGKSPYMHTVFIDKESFVCNEKIGIKMDSNFTIYSNGTVNQLARSIIADTYDDTFMNSFLNKVLGKIMAIKYISAFKYYRTNVHLSFKCSSENFSDDWRKWQLEDRKYKINNKDQFIEDMKKGTIEEYPVYASKSSLAKFTIPICDFVD